MIESLKTLFGEARLALLAQMPLVKEKLGLEAHLQAACSDAASPAHALILAVQRAGGVPTQADLEAYYTALKNEEPQSERAAEPQPEEQQRETVPAA